jgi:hypothetical protein
MYGLGRTRFRRTLRRKLAAGLVLLGYLAATIGLPLPALAHKDLSTPFPCQDNPCGCQSAEQCWTSCCCYTVEEHWAWARAHDVEPPAYAVRPADDGWDSRPQREQEEAATCSCCAKKCQEKPVSPKQVRWVNRAAALRCQGGSQFGVAAPSVPPPPLVFWRPALELASRLSTCDESPSLRPSNPPDPPPRNPSI